VAEYWTDAHLLRGHARLKAGRHREALADYQAAGSIPENLPSERRGSDGRRAEVAYWIGIACEAMGDREKARQSWKEAAAAPSMDRPREIGLSDGSIQLYYRALALRRLGDTGAAEEIFRNLVQASAAALQRGSEKIDFFASFGEQQSQRSRLALAHYIAGLGQLGLGVTDKGRQEMAQVLTISPDHLGAKFWGQAQRPW